MATFRVTFADDQEAQDFTADRMEATGNGVRLYRNSGEVETEVAYFRDGSYVACFEVAATQTGKKTR